MLFAIVVNIYKELYPISVWSTADDASAENRPTSSKRPMREHIVMKGPRVNNKQSNSKT